MILVEKIVVLDEESLDFQLYMEIAWILWRLGGRIAKLEKENDMVAVLTTTNHVILYGCSHVFVAEINELGDLLEEVSKICRDEFDKVVQLIKKVLPNEYADLLSGVSVLLG
jgi:hypothetical protein